MNNARMWLAVKPSIGIPLLIGSVAVQALIVHFAILTHTTWFPAFLQGGKMPQRSGEVLPTRDGPPIKLSQTQTTPAGTPVVVASVKMPS